jgi:hypothetical protein
MSDTVENPAVLPAIEAVKKLRKELGRSVHKEGGLAEVRQGRSLALLGTIEATLLQVVPLGSMINTINQQAQIAANAMKSLNRMQLTEGDNNGDDGTSASKGE